MDKTLLLIPLGQKEESAVNYYVKIYIMKDQGVAFIHSPMNSACIVTHHQDRIDHNCPTQKYLNLGSGINNKTQLMKRGFSRCHAKNSIGLAILNLQSETIGDIHNPP